MSFRSALIVAICAAIHLGNALAAENCGLKPVSSIPIEIGGDGRIAIQAQFGAAPVKLRLELARIQSTVTAKLAKRLGFVQSGGLSDSNTGYEEDDGAARYWTNVKKIQLGQLVWPERGMYIFGSVDGQDDLDGTAGNNLFDGYDVEIDPAKHRIILYSQNHCEGKVVHWADSFFVVDANYNSRGEISSMPHSEGMWTKVVLDGHEMRAVFDTGKSVTSMSAWTADRAFDFTAKKLGAPILPSVGITGLPTTYFDHVFPTLDLGPIRLNNKKVSVIEFDGWYPGYLMLGMDVIAKLHMFIAYGEQKIYFTLADEGHDKTATDIR